MIHNHHYMCIVAFVPVKVSYLKISRLILGEYILNILYTDCLMLYEGDINAVTVYRKQYRWNNIMNLMF